MELLKKAISEQNIAVIQFLKSKNVISPMECIEAAISSGNVEIFQALVYPEFQVIDKHFELSPSAKMSNELAKILMKRQDGKPPTYQQTIDPLIDDDGSDSCARIILNYNIEHSLPIDFRLIERTINYYKGHHILLYELLVRLNENMFTDALNIIQIKYKEVKHFDIMKVCLTHGNQANFEILKARYAIDDLSVNALKIKDDNLIQACIDCNVDKIKELMKDQTINSTYFVRHYQDETLLKQIMSDPVLCNVDMTCAALYCYAMHMHNTKHLILKNAKVINSEVVALITVDDHGFGRTERKENIQHHSEIICGYRHKIYFTFSQLVTKCSYHYYNRYYECDRDPIPTVAILQPYYDQIIKIL